MVLARMILAALLLVAIQAVAQQGGPRVACKEASWQFGEKQSTQSVEHVFAIRNEGDAPLSITGIRGCCGATTRLATNSIPPGSNTTLAITLSLAGRSGKQRKSFYVLSNDPKEPYLQLRFIGSVIPVKASQSQAAGSVSNAAPADGTPTRRSEGQVSNIPPVIVDYFFESGCPDCERVKEQVLPGLRERFEDLYALNDHDIGGTGDVLDNKLMLKQ